jgi:hypothetical protein
VQLPQQEQAEHVVDVSVGKNRSGDGRLAGVILAFLFSRMKIRRSLNLRAQIGRSSEQKPGLRVGADGKLGLGAGLAVERSGAQGAAVGAGAIPLGEPSAGSRAENFHAHRYRV